MELVEGKVAFVTGAASGIGFAIAASLARAGVKVMLCDIDVTSLDAAVSSLRSKGANVDVSSVRADVSVKDELQAAADATIERFGKVHILINNAGVVGDTDYGRWSDSSWNWILGVNLMAVIWGIEIFGPLIESYGDGGQIVCTSSVGGLYAGRHSAYSAYNVTKYGVVALCEGLRETLALRGIGVSLLCPGMVQTQILDAKRHLPARYTSAAMLDGQPDAEPPGAMAQAIANGVSPEYVGDLVVEGILKDWQYIFTDTDFEAKISDRFAAIERGFDLIRDREPLRPSA